MFAGIITISELGVTEVLVSLGFARSAKKYDVLLFS